eukprot:gnl/TRDRNA2_/TRDRNA2_152048_c0_seq3.p1 gnl/TRDRNA2_/TRDRNA2_152048_c0~~gnl/TRDRNA2_/TRDRNA2_152048_c0_seq3.p1  ORF type:complete len:134 (+),score=7.94 gnl/TRDRNA2_/TRDRNA2_152048_c0_seq3:47-448(+)
MFSHALTSAFVLILPWFPLECDDSMFSLPMGYGRDLIQTKAATRQAEAQRRQRTHQESAFSERVGRQAQANMKRHKDMKRLSLCNWHEVLDGEYGRATGAYTGRAWALACKGVHRNEDEEQQHRGDQVVAFGF